MSLPPDVLRLIYVKARRDPKTQVAMRAATKAVHELPAPNKLPYLRGQGKYQQLWNNLERRMHWAHETV